MKTTFIFLILSSAITVWPQLPNEIVFTGDDRVFVIRPDGTGQTSITSPAVGTDRPRWSRDGSHIVFTKGNQCVPDFTSRIWKMNADGSNQTLVDPNWYIPWQPVFSPHADRIAYVGVDCYDGSANISIANADGSNPVWVTGILTYTYGLDWSPVGERLVYSELVHEQNSQYYRICSINTDGTDRVVLTTRAQGLNFDPVWSPDGSKIAFVSGRDGNSEIYTMNSDGSNPARITNSTSSDVGPTWSPDGTRLAFMSNRNGPYNIYVVNADGTNTIQITQNEFNSFFPHWNPSVTPDRTAFDFDDDGRSDISVFRPSDSVWYLNRSAQGFTAVQFGTPTDQIVPGDYDGDGEADIAVYSEGTWRIIQSTTDTARTEIFGTASDIPVPADYTGDGRDELGVYRNGQWWVLDLSNNQHSLINFGLAGDKPVPADYDGDDIVDQAVYRNGEWHLNRSSLGYTVAYFGLPNDKPVVGDYDGDDKADLAIYRDGTWYLQQSTAGFSTFEWGLSTDTPAPADYDGDGKTDATVYRDGLWYLLQSTGGISIQHFGLTGDQPLAASFIR
jgi:Tol biopolymer transport system component